MTRKHPTIPERPLPDPATTDESFYSIETTASATECTGLMPATPDTEDGRENLSELMAIHAPATASSPAPGRGKRENAHPGDGRN